MGRCQRRMSAELDFAGRREPPQQPRPVVSPADESCLRKVHLGRDVLHPVVAAIAVQDTDRRRIARKRLIGERVDLQKR
jgi:hypothetical protein